MDYIQQAQDRVLWCAVVNIPSQSSSSMKGGQFLDQPSSCSRLDTGMFNVEWRGHVICNRRHQTVSTCSKELVSYRHRYC